MLNRIFQRAAEPTGDEEGTGGWPPRLITTSTSVAVSLTARDGREFRFTVEDPQWWRNLREDRARALAADLVNGLRGRIREARPR